MGIMLPELPMVMGRLEGCALTLKGMRLLPVQKSAGGGVLSDGSLSPGCKAEVSTPA